jgi:hypothetical protein
MAVSTTHISRLSHPHALVHRPPLQSAPDYQILIFDLVELRRSRAERNQLVCTTLVYIETCLILHRLDLLGIKCSSSKSKVSQFDVSCRIHQEVLSMIFDKHQALSLEKAEAAHLGLEITMNITEFVQLANSHEHLCGIKPSVFLLEYS